MISGIFGLPGAGKSLLCGWIAQRGVKGRPISIGTYSLQHFRKYDRVYTNFPCSCCYQIDFEELGRKDFSNSLIVIDEIMLLCDSRNFKSFGENLKFFFSQHRKMHVDFIWCSQSYDDTDKKIRNLTSQFFYVYQAGLQFSVVRPIEAFFRVTDGAIKSGYEYAPLINSKFMWRPFYYKYADTDAIINSALPDEQPEALLWEFMKGVGK